MLTLDDVARIFGVSPDTIQQWCKQGKIKTCNTGLNGRPDFRHEDVAIAYLDRSIQQCLGH